jgi:hypothetical protein
MCTTAAPTTFEPYKHGVFGYCVDGGVFANDPGGLALAAARTAGQSLDSVSMLALGTGGFINRYPFRKLSIPARNLGILPWMWPTAVEKHNVPALPLLSAMLDGTTGVYRTVCEGLLGRRYRQVQVNLDEVIPMDDPAGVPKLEKLAAAFIKTDEWKKVVAWMKDQLEE